jgi:hypothetical protein
VVRQHSVPATGQGGGWCIPMLGKLLNVIVVLHVYSENIGGETALGSGDRSMGGGRGTELGYTNAPGEAGTGVGQCANPFREICSR